MNTFIMREKSTRQVALSNRDKILFPENEYTKGDLITYYERIADHLLPHLHNRPINLQRFPNGIRDEGFYQKDRPDYFPTWIESVEVKKQGGTVNQIICNNIDTLRYLASQACVTIHSWLCLKNHLDYPDRLIFDLDPPADRFDLVIKGARAMKDILEKLNLIPYLMTTGSKGLHIVIPLTQEQTFDEVREFARNFSKSLAARQPDDFTTEVRKEKRKGRLFLDYLRNAYAQTGVSPYSIRAREGAPVATPLRWDELNPKLSSQTYNIKNIFRRLGNMDDPWKNFFQDAQKIEVGSWKMIKE